jgi:hypothetical protein
LGPDTLRTAKFPGLRLLTGKLGGAICAEHLGSLLKRLLRARGLDTCQSI